MLFRDRLQAATLLAQKLERYRGDRPLVLGIPRGAVPMTQHIAEHLEGDLDVVLVHKIGAPGNPEYAIGSVSEFGSVYFSQAARQFELSPTARQWMAQTEIESLQSQRRRYSPLRPPHDPHHRTVIVVDDGIATGATMIAAARAVRAQRPKRLIIAAPVASGDAFEKLSLEADELEVLEIPPGFYSVSQFYEEFLQVSDDEVSEILSHASRSAPVSRAG